jgi:hypothetical protein
MIDLTPEARTRFEQYLTRMRTALRGSRAVEPTEVEQNVREHVELALAGVDGPIATERLNEVLTQLGPPERWLSDEDRPWWRRVLQRVVDGPEEWRLTYLTFGIFALSMLTLPLGIGILFLVLAFLLSRAEVDLLDARDESLGPRRWLVLPAIWVVLVLVVLGALFPPIAAGTVIGLEHGGIHHFRPVPATHPGSFDRFRIEAGYVAAVAGVWWMILAAIFAAAMKPFRTLFHPVTEGVHSKHAGILALVGAMLAALGLGLMFLGF